MAQKTQCALIEIIYKNQYAVAVLIKPADKLLSVDIIATVLRSVGRMKRHRLLRADENCKSR